MKRSEKFMLHNVGGINLLTPLGTQVVDMNGLVLLNETARCVWELLEKDRTQDELAAAVADKFDVDPARARADVQAFLDVIGPMGMIAG